MLLSNAKLNETRIKSQRREVHMKSVSKLHDLENSLRVGIKRKAQWSLRLKSRHRLKLIKRRRGGDQTRVLPTSARVVYENQTRA